MAVNKRFLTEWSMKWDSVTHITTDNLPLFVSTQQDARGTIGHRPLTFSALFVGSCACAYALYAMAMQRLRVRTGTGIFMFVVRASYVHACKFENLGRQTSRKHGQET